MSFRALFGAVGVSLAGIGGSVAAIKGLEERHAFRVPAITVPSLIGLSSGFLLLGVGFAFIRHCELKLLHSGLVKVVTERAWRNRNMGRLALRGDELEEIARSITNSDSWGHLFRIASESRTSVSRTTYSLLNKSELDHVFVQQVKPFRTSEKVVPERLTSTLSGAAEGLVREKIKRLQDRIFLSVSATMSVLFVVMVGMDRANFFVPPRNKKEQSR